MDAISVEQAGFPCVGYPGVNNWKPHFTRCFYGCAEVIVLADGDDAGRNAAKTVAKAIGSVADAVHVVDLPDGADANSILATRGVEGLQELLA